MSNIYSFLNDTCWRCDKIVYLHKEYNAKHGDYPHQLQFYLEGIPSMFTISFQSKDDLDKNYERIKDAMEED